MSQSKNVQSEIEMDTYAKLKREAKRQKKPLKSIVREALEEYTKRRETPVEEDPLFAVVGDFETEEGDWSKRKDWRP